MNYRILGKTDYTVSELGLGTYGLGGQAYGQVGKQDALDTITAALDLGCNFFDTADCYGDGQSEEFLAAIVNPIKTEKIIIATKIGVDFYQSNRQINLRSNYLKSALEKSLKRLRTDCLDLIQIHNPTLEDIERGEVFELFQDFQKQGLIKFWGVSLRQPSDGLKAIAKASQLRVDLATIQVAFNVFQRQAKDKLFELADKHNVGLIVREPLCRGFLSGKYDIAEDFETHAVVKFLNENKALPEDILKAFDQVQKIFKKYNRPEDPVQLALKYILSFNQVGTVIPGAKNISQARQNLTSFELPDFEPELLAELNNFSQQFAYTM